MKQVNVVSIRTDHFNTTSQRGKDNATWGV